MHLGPPRELVVGKPDLAVVLAHGRGGSAADMAGIAEALALDDVRYVLLQADAGSWYPNRFMARLADNEPWLTAALDHYERAVSGLIAAGVPETRIIVGGFSQGACLTSEFLARHPRHYAAAVIFTGGLIGPEGTRWPVRSELAGMPAYISSSEIDEWIPASRARETVRWLNACGAAAKSVMFEDRTHRVSDEEIGGARQIVERARR